MLSKRIITNDPKVYFDNAVIKQPDYIKQKTLRVVVDSRERNTLIFPNPNFYEINLVEDIENVSSITLLSSNIKHCQYTINRNNNVLHLAYDNQVHNITIDTGDYTEIELATELQNSLNTIVGSSDFKVSYSKRKDNFTFQCVNAFGLIFRGQEYTHTYNSSIDVKYPANSIGKTLGFGMNNFISHSEVTGDGFTHVIRSEFRKNFDSDQYVVLKIDMIELNKSTLNNVNNSFAIFTDETTKPFHMEYNTKKIHPPLGKLNKFKIAFTDIYGNLYDFQNVDHVMEFMICCK